MSDREVRVRAGNCPCPGTPHKFETITLVPEVTLPMGIAAYAALEDSPDGADMQAALAVIYLRYGIESWTFLEQTDDAITPVPVTQQNALRLITWKTGAYEVAQKADKLFTKDLFLPLGPKLSKSSPNGPMETSTPPTPVSGSKPPKPSRPSSQNGTAGKVSAVPVP